MLTYKSYYKMFNEMANGNEYFLTKTKCDHIDTEITGFKSFMMTQRIWTYIGRNLLYLIKELIRNA